MANVLNPQTAPLWAFPRETGSSSSEEQQMPPSFAHAWLRVGRVPLDRILTEPAPGSATEEDAVESKAKYGLNCELVDGILVAQAMGQYESQVAFALGYFIHQYLEAHPIGVLAGPDGPCKTLLRHIRKPDVGFVSFETLKLHPPRKNRLSRCPDLAVEVLSPGNTTSEMEMKLKEYFETGARLVWYIEPQIRSVRVYTAANSWEDIRSDGTLSGGDVLPGFELPLARLFEKAGPRIED